MRAFLILFSVFVFLSSPVMAEDLYICPMHPHIHGQAGDKCPICGMDLVLQKTMPSGGPHTMIDPTYLQTLGVRTAPVEMTAMGADIRAFGRFVADTRREYIVSVRNPGWIRQLDAGAVGTIVKKGQRLFTYYSPDLLAAQSDYLIGKKDNRLGDPLNRLRLHGMDEEALAAFTKSGKILYETPFHAPMDGIVTELFVRPGSYVEAGSMVLHIQDFSSLWVEAAVPARQIGQLAPGQRATIALPDGRSRPATIDLILPVTNPASRTATVRLTIDNADGTLRPDDFADVTFSGASRSALAVPAEAILYGRDGARVIKATGTGAFETAAVKTGATSGGKTEILSGLQAGDEIVMNGQFMIDAESTLRGGTARMESAHEHR